MSPTVLLPIYYRARVISTEVVLSKYILERHVSNSKGRLLIMDSRDPAFTY